MFLVTRRLLDDDSELSANNSPDPGQFDLIAIFMLVVLTAVAGAVLGAVFALIAQVRREPAFQVRVIALIVNLTLAGYGIYLLAPFREQ